MRDEMADREDVAGFLYAGSRCFQRIHAQV